MEYILVFCLFWATSSATDISSVLPKQERIVGGNLTTIDRYPSTAGILEYKCLDHIYPYICGSTIINKRSVLTAAHCISAHVPISYYKIRVGSSYRNSGGVVHDANKRLLHPGYNRRILSNDIGILYTAIEFEYNEYVAPAPLATRDYYLADNEPVWAVGWGIYNVTTSQLSEQLRDVMVYTVNFETCRDRYAELRRLVLENMLCAMILDVGGKSQCHGDSGNPMFHNNVVVGLCSWGDMCGNPRYPFVNVRISYFADWISANL